MHEVDAHMMPPTAPDTISTETWGVLAAPRRGMACEAEALFTNPAIASGSLRAGVAQLTARRRLTPKPRARRIFNVHAHANRRAPPGGNPGRGRQREPDRRI